MKLFKKNDSDNIADKVQESAKKEILRKAKKKMKATVVHAAASAISSAIVSLTSFISAHIVPIVAATVLVVVAGSWALDVIDSKNNPQRGIYETLGTEELNNLIAVSGNNDDGYYLAYRKGIGDKIAEIAKDFEDTGYQNVNDDNVILKLIQAELYTQYPNLVGEIGHEAEVATYNGGIMDIPYYRQTTGYSCGHTSFAMVASYLTGKEVKEWDIINGFCPGTAIDLPVLVSKMADYYGIGPARYTKDAKKIRESLLAGMPVIALVNHSKNHLFTDGDHYIVLTGVDSEGKIHVNNPNGRALKDAYDLEEDIMPVLRWSCYFENGPNLVAPPNTGILHWPTESNQTKITSYFGPREQPTPGASTNHGAIDIGVPEGTNVYACASGKVITASYQGNAGNFVEIDHGDGYVSGYMHNSEIKVSVGDTVEAGQLIALSGSTGNVTGPHIHFQIKKDGTKIDPLKFKYDNGMGDGTETGFGTQTSITNLDGFLFIGDSITVGMQDVADDDVIFKAVVGVGSQYWLDHFEELPGNSLDVKGINVFLGTNDYDYASGKMKELLKKLHERYPNKNIFVDKLLDDKSPNVNNITREQYIKDIEKYCEGQSYLTYIDATEGVNIADNDCHPASRTDYETLWKNIKAAIIKSCSGDKSKLAIGKDTGEGVLGFQGGIRIRRVTPSKSIGALTNTGSGSITNGHTMEGEWVSEINSYLTKSGAKGSWGVYAKNLNTDDEIVRYDDNIKLESGDLISLFIMATAYQEIEKNNADIDKDLIKKMIVENKDEAADEIYDKLGSEKIQKYISDNEYENTEINAKISEERKDELKNNKKDEDAEDKEDSDKKEDDDEKEKDTRNYTSASDVAKLLEKIYKGDCVSSSASKEMLDYLKQQKQKDRIPEGLPKEKNVETANKIGELRTLQADAAIVYKENAPYILVTMATELSDTVLAKENIVEISKIIYDKIDKKREDEKDSKNHIIALVVGHGNDSGAGNDTYEKGNTDTTGVTNPAWKETDAMQKVVEQVKEKMQSNSNIKIITDGYGKPDKDRLSIAKDKGADIFIELHLDSVNNSSTSGVSAYYQQDSGKKSSRLAEMLSNEVMTSLNLGQFDGAKEKDINTFNEGKISDFEGGAVKLYGGFMSNKSDMEKLSAEDGLKKYADGIVNGLEQYLKELDEGKLDDGYGTLTETYDTSIRSKIIEMKYTPEVDFDRMMDEANEKGSQGTIDDKILEYYTLDSDWNLITATWTYSSDTGVRFNKNPAVDYRSVVSKYVTPFEYLLNYYIDMKQDNFISAFADLVMESQFIIAVQDNVSTTETTTTVTTEYSDNSYGDSTVTTEVSETVSEKVELTYADTWFVKFWKDSSYIYGTGFNGGTGTASQMEIAEFARNGGGAAANGGYCEAWAEQVYRNKGYNVPYYPCAWEGGTAAIANGGGTSMDNIPIGAAVFGKRSRGGVMCNGHDAAHVGIYVGNGEIASNVGGVSICTLDYWDQVWGFRGWGWFPGTESLAESGSGSGSGSSYTGTQGQLIGNFRITAYCNCSICCGVWSGGPTASGAMPKQGVTIAVEPSQIPLGSYVMFNGHVYHAEDTGSGIGTNCIDLYFDSHSEALQWGVKYMDVYWADGVTEGGIANGNRDSSQVSYLTDSAYLMGKVTDTKSSNTSVTPGPNIYHYDDNGNVTSVVYTSIITKVDTHTISNEYESGESNIAGNEYKFLVLFRKYPDALSALKAKWLITITGKNERSAVFLDLTKYLLYRLLGDDFGVTEFDYTIYLPEDFQSMFGYNGEILIEYLKGWENDPLRLFINGKSEFNSYIGQFVTQDKQYYLCYSDYPSNYNYGYGVCHMLNSSSGWNGEVVKAYSELGVNIKESQHLSVGTKMNVEITDQVMKHEVDMFKNYVKAQLEKNGIDLEETKIDALTAVSYQYGNIGNFANAYRAYYLTGNYQAFRNNFVVNGYLPFLTGWQGREYEIQRANANWKLFHEGIYQTAGGEILDPNDYKMSSGITPDMQKLMNLSDAEAWSLITGGRCSSRPTSSIGKVSTTWIEVPVRVWENPNDPNNMKITSDKIRLEFATPLAELFKSFFTDLYNQCPDFVIKKSSGEYGGYRQDAVTSGHTYGAAFDLNWETDGNGYSGWGSRRPYSKAEWSALPESHKKHEIIYTGSPMVDLAHKYTLSWGGEWRTSWDNMHFSFIGDWTRAELQQKFGNK